MIVSMIVAMTQSRVIGANNALPWHLPEELKRFRALTSGHAILMGRKTFVSLPKVLPDRDHYVITRSPDFKEQDPKARGSEHVFTAPDPVAALAMLRERIEQRGDIPEEVFVIGGGEIFAQLMPYAFRLYVSVVKQDVEGDTFFPAIDPREWAEAERTPFEAFDSIVYERR